MRAYYETDPKYAHDNSQPYPTAYGRMPESACNFPATSPATVSGVSRQDAKSETIPEVMLRRLQEKVAEK